MQRLEVDASLKAGNLEQGLDLRPEVQGIAVLHVVQRLLPGAIAGEDAEPAGVIPHCNGEHPIDGLGKALPVALIQMRKHLRVAFRMKSMTLCDQSPTDVTKVVELPVLRRPDSLGLVSDRLPAAVNVDDAQSARGESEVL